ncbi:MAG: hypothetical protein LBO08_01280 [Rickettsiales bacterium]|nr:hypothetical protein [Rickettsiales bacterium]
MKKLIFIFYLLIFILPAANGAVRDGAAVSRAAAQTLRGAPAEQIASRGTASRAAADRVAAPRSAVESVASRAATQTTASRAATPRNAVMPSGAISARSGMTPVNSSRAGIARATAVFSDMSKMGGSYGTCREAYNTCMDQFCATLNDTYRRCICSDRYTVMRDKEDALDRAKTMLVNFQDENLNAVNLSAAEVSAMYTATAGENAIKKDPSASAKMLEEISDILSGKATAKKGAASKLIQVDFSANVDDIFGGGDFGDQGGAKVADLVAGELYQEVNKQCTNAVGSSACEDKSVLTMVRSSYSIIIGQDCNAYQKKIDTQSNAVEDTVRMAYKTLREARLEEYQSHNSADMNQCIGAVKTAVLDENVCGKNYNRCMDTTGQYVNATTGEVIYGPMLFNLTKVIKLELADNQDVLKANQNFDKFLDTKKPFAARALDACRDISANVWTQFKRNALIEIAQAQDEKIEEIKMSCVSIMKECYDTQLGGLKAFDDTTAQKTGALSAYAARAMCQDKVVACAALYTPSGGTECKLDNNGRVSNAQTCGLGSLMTFVGSVDATRVEEGCEVGLNNFVKDLCTPVETGQAYPYRCRMMKPGTADDTGAADATSLYGQLYKFTSANCNITQDAGVSTRGFNPDTARITDRVFADATDLLSSQLKKTCVAGGGLWVNEPALIENGMEFDTTYTSTVYGSGNSVLGVMNGISLNSAGKIAKTGAATDSLGWGACVNNSVQIACRQSDIDTGGQGLAKYNAVSNECEYDEGWYKYKCEIIVGGRWTADKACLYKGDASSGGGGGVDVKKKD